MDDLELIEQTLKESRFSTFSIAKGKATSLSDLVRRVVMTDLCPNHESGYRWSAASNYLNSCRRALADGRPQPISRAKNGWLSQDDRDRIWLLVDEVASFWTRLAAEVGADRGTDYLTRDQLLVTETGRRLFSLTRAPRTRLSALAA